MSENITDYFNSTYTLSLQSTFDPSQNVTVTLTRNGCVWAGNQTIGGNAWQFRLVSFSTCNEVNDLGWQVLGVFPENPFGNLFIDYKLDEDGIPITQGTPVGSYGMGGARWDTITVS
jgi:hypothetical protein